MAIAHRAIVHYNEALEFASNREKSIWLFLTIVASETRGVCRDEVIIKIGDTILVGAKVISPARCLYSDHLGHLE